MQRTLLTALAAIGLSAFSLCAQSCTQPPSGLVSWWAAEGDALDRVGGNDGSLVGSAGFGMGETGQGFLLDGNSGDGIQLGSCPNLQLQDFTVEAWVQRGDQTICSHASGGSGEIFCYGVDGYSVYLDPNGKLSLGKTAVDAISSTSGFHDLGFHHVAVTKSGSTVIFYLDGQAANSATYSSIFTFNTSAAIGTQGDNLNNTFLGIIDELAIYNRALSASEIATLYQAGQAGKCFSSAPVIEAQPTNETVFPGLNATFSVAVSGTPPFNYQWTLNGNDLTGATNAFLTLTNVQLSDSGDNLSVTVTNAQGSVSSSTATLSVVPPPPCVTPPTNLISWWQAEGNALDLISTNDGKLQGATSYASGEVGQAFHFDGNQGGGVLLGSCPGLQLQDFSVEAWIQRSSTTASSFAFGGSGEIICFGTGGYSLFLNSSGQLALGQTDGNTVFSQGPGINDLSYHHIAMTKSGSNVTFYVDGVAAPPAFLNATFYFTTPVAIGAKGDDLNFCFLGNIDELAVYSGALTSSQIQQIYNIGTGGKCPPPVPPVFKSQKTQNVTNYVGQTITFGASARGLSPIYYQWQFNGTNLAGATGTNLVLTNLQLANSGSYELVAYNMFGPTTNIVANLTVNSIPTCSPPPAGLVSWWPAESNALDRVSGNNGVPTNSPVYGPGEVGSGFVLNGSSQGIEVGNPPNLQLQNFTIEAWIKRASTTLTSHSSSGNALIFGYGSGGYGFYLDAYGRLALSQIGITAQTLTTITITDTNLHHIAVTKSGSTVMYYLDGIAYNVGAYNPTFTFTTPAAIGARGDTLDNSFLGTIDELSIYDRALSATEIQTIYSAALSGKCNLPVAPTIVQQSPGKTVFPGTNITFTVTAAGSTPLSYQWLLNNAVVTGATNSSLTFSNVQPSNAGGYTLMVSNIAGVIVSSNATLTVNVVQALANNQLLTNAQYSFSNTVTITLSNYYTNGDIFYTLDGSIPDAGSALYTGPFTISQSAMLQTLGYSPDFSQAAVSAPVSILIVPFYTLNTSTAGGGRIAVNPTNNAAYPSGTSVTLTAVPSNGWTFLQWTGDTAGTNPVNTVAMTRNKSVQAVFGTTVGSTTNGNGSVSFNPAGGFYPFGTSLQVSAVPKPGSYLAAWGNAATGNTNPLTFLVTNANPTISALFTTVGNNQASLTVVPVGRGKVSASPRANVYSLNSSVTVTATPDAGKSFLGWSGDATGTQNPLTITLTTNKTLYANFSTNHSLAGYFGAGGFADGFTLDLNGEFGTHYRLDESSNLVNWISLYNLTNTVGTIHFIDTNATSTGSLFYRAVTLP